MPDLTAKQLIRLALALLFGGLCLLQPAWAQTKNLAPGFASIPKGSALLLMPLDVELFSLSAGGITEPRADWTQAANAHMHTALNGRFAELGLAKRELSEADADDFAEVSALHAAVARAIALHHVQGGDFALPTKQGKLDWSLGDAVQPIRARSGADYGLFVWVRDSYASSERKFTMFAMAVLGVGITGGFQTGYASLVDLKNGQVMWFNRLLRATGDLREAAPAAETMRTLLNGFPESK